MNKREMRRLAIGAVRSEMRRTGMDPQKQTAGDALLVLDDLARSHLTLIGSYWYRNASENQLNLFDREWRHWRITHPLDGAWSKG